MEIKFTVLYLTNSHTSYTCINMFYLLAHLAMPCIFPCITYFLGLSGSSQTSAFDYNGWPPPNRNKLSVHFYITVWCLYFILYLCYINCYKQTPLPHATIWQKAIPKFQTTVHLIVIITPIPVYSISTFLEQCCLWSKVFFLSILQIQKHFIFFQESGATHHTQTHIWKI